MSDSVCCFSLASSWSTIKSTVASNSEILASLESCDGRNDHNMHTTHCPYKLHTQYFQTWTQCDYIYIYIYIYIKSQNYGHEPKQLLHWSTKFHFFLLAETKCANSYVNWAAEHENHNENASLATVFELSCLTCTT